MIPIKRTNEVKMSDLTSFINDYFRLIVTEINHNVRTKYFETYTIRYPSVDPITNKRPSDLKDGHIGYFPCRPADPLSGRPNPDEDPGLGQGVYIYLLDWLAVPPDPLNGWERPGKWHKFNTTSVP